VDVGQCCGIGSALARTSRRWRWYGFVRFAAVRRNGVAARGVLRDPRRVPKVVLADRMACLKAGVVAARVVATPDDVRFASHYRFRPDFRTQRTRSSRVGNLLGYAKTDLIVGGAHP
jgi:hypothetical protein